MAPISGGPNGANNLFILDGQLQVDVSMKGTGSASFVALIGPTFVARQVMKASASVFPVAFGITGSSQGQGVGWTIDSPDADWDDESGQIALRFDVTIANETGG